MNLHLHLPGLLAAKAEGESLHPVTQLELPALARLLARATGEPVSLSALTGAALPVAALGALSHNFPLPGHWFRLDPVELSADHRGIYLLGCESLGLDTPEADAFIAEINAFLAEDGLTLWRGENHAWYLNSPAPVALSTTPLPAVMGRDLARFQPEGADARRWQTLLTELSMLLHASRANQARAERRAKPVSGLWLWGEGDLPATASLPCQSLHTDSAALTGYARMAGVAHAPLPAAYADLAGDGAKVVAVHAGELDGLMRHGEVLAWMQAVQRWHQAWFAPILAALQSGALESLTLYPGNGRSYRVRRGDLARFWRRERPLARYL